MSWGYSSLEYNGLHLCGSQTWLCIVKLTPIILGECRYIPISPCAGSPSFMIQRGRARWHNQMTVLFLPWLKGVGPGRQTRSEMCKARSSLKKSVLPTRCTTVHACHHSAHSVLTNPLSTESSLLSRIHLKMRHRIEPWARKTQPVAVPHVTSLH